MMCVASGAREKGDASFEYTGANMTSASKIGISKDDMPFSSQRIPSLLKQSGDEPDGFLKPLKSAHQRLLLLDFEVRVCPAAARWRIFSKRYLRSADSRRKLSQHARKSAPNPCGHDTLGGR